MHLRYPSYSVMRITRGFRNEGLSFPETLIRLNQFYKEPPYSTLSYSEFISLVEMSYFENVGISLRNLRNAGTERLVKAQKLVANGCTSNKLQAFVKGIIPVLKACGLNFREMRKLLIAMPVYGEGPLNQPKLISKLVANIWKTSRSAALTTPKAAS